MRCHDVDRLSSAYVDGELDEHRSSALRGHLRTCDDCRARVHQLALVRDALGDLDPADPPASLWSEIQGQLAAEEIADSRAPVRLWWRVWSDRLRRHALVTACGAAAVALVAVWGVRHESGGRAVAPVSELATARVAKAAVADDELAAFDDGPNRRAAITTASELEHADQRYERTLADLRQIVGDERELWTDDETRAFEGVVAELAGEVDARKRDVVGSDDPRARDALYAAYRAEIAFMQEAAVSGAGAAIAMREMQ